MIRYQTIPAPIRGLPPGIPYILGNETAERYSFYGMKAILIIFMTQYLRGNQGEFDLMTEEEAKVWFHGFISAAYCFPIIGAILSDTLLGKYRTILLLSFFYCLGHFILSVDETRNGLVIGLALIALGAGGIKPCTSAHVGDQFSHTNSHLLPKVFSWFYFFINIGGLFGFLLAEPLLARYGSKVAFGIPGIFMLIATVVFWIGRHKFVHVPPGGLSFLKELRSKPNLRVLSKLSILYIFIAIFWSLFEQQNSAWVLQAKHMDTNLIIQWRPSQFQWLNSAFVLMFIPLFNRYLYPAFDSFFPLTPLRKSALVSFSRLRHL